MRIRTVLSACLVAGVLLPTVGCTTVLGTNIETDRAVPFGSHIEPLSKVQASVSYGQALWAVGVDREMYEEVRKAALKQKGGDLLINAKITTTLTSYLALYYTAEVSIEGTAARLTAAPPATR
jgi:hypothetical protein